MKIYCKQIDGIMEVTRLNDSSVDRFQGPFSGFKRPIIGLSVYTYIYICILCISVAVQKPKNPIYLNINDSHLTTIWIKDANDSPTWIKTNLNHYWQWCRLRSTYSFPRTSFNKMELIIYHRWMICVFFIYMFRMSCSTWVSLLHHPSYGFFIYEKKLFQKTSIEQGILIRQAQDTKWPACLLLNRQLVAIYVVHHSSQKITTSTCFKSVSQASQSLNEAIFHERVPPETSTSCQNLTVYTGTIRPLLW